VDRIKLSVEKTRPVYLLETEGVFTPGSRPGRTLGESVSGIFEMDSSDWSNGIRYHTFESDPALRLRWALSAGGGAARALLVAGDLGAPPPAARVLGRGLHSFPFQLNLSKSRTHS
jgi:hypothetical protein